MKAFAQDWFRHIRESAQFATHNSHTNKYDGHSGTGREKYKQVARILKHLRNSLDADTDLIKVKVTQPTDAMIENLVFNCPAPLFDSDDWPTIINTVLLFLKNACDNTTPATRHFTRQDGHTPLFPNGDLYDELDVYRFCEVLLNQLALDD